MIESFLHQQKDCFVVSLQSIDSYTRSCGFYCIELIQQSLALYNILSPHYLSAGQCQVPEYQENTSEAVGVRRMTNHAAIQRRHLAERNTKKRKGAQYPLDASGRVRLLLNCEQNQSLKRIKGSYRTSPMLYTLINISIVNAALRLSLQR